MLEVLRRSELEDWFSGLLWLILTLVGGLVPLWLLWLFLRLFSQVVNLGTFTANGEFALYSASVISATLYIVTKDYGMKFIKRFGTGGRSSLPVRMGFPRMAVFVAACIIVLLLATGLFAGSTIVHLPGVGLSLDTPFLSYSSIALFFVTIVLSYLVTVMDISMSSVSEGEIRDMFSGPYTELAAKVDELRGEK